MHELAVTKTLLNMTISECKEKGIKLPKRVFTSLGKLTAYKKEPIMLYFDLLKKEMPMLADAFLIIKEIDGKISCNDCGKITTIEEAYMLLCGTCESGNVEIIDGKQFYIDKIES